MGVLRHIYVDVIVLGWEKKPAKENLTKVPHALRKRTVASRAGTENYRDARTDSHRPAAFCDRVMRCGFNFVIANVKKVHDNKVKDNT